MQAVDKARRDKDIHTNDDRNNVMAERDARRRHFIINGNLWKVIFAISLPLMTINLLTFVYNIIDSVLAAKINQGSIASVVVLSQINNMLTVIGMALSSGGMIIISRLIGKYDIAKAKAIANTMIIISVMVSILMLALLLPLSRPILKLFGTSERIIDDGLGYFRIQIITAGVMIFNNVFLGLEKSRGRTGNILILNVVVMSAKILMSVLLIYVFDFNSLFLLALTTLIAQAGFALYIVVRILMPHYPFRFNPKNKDLSSNTLRMIVKLSLPIFIGRFVFSLGKVLVNAISSNFYSQGKYLDKTIYGSNYGDRVTGALGVSNHLGGFATNVLNSVDESEALIISINLGARNRARAIKAFAYTLILNLGLAGAGIAVLAIFNDDIVNLFAHGDKDYATMITNIFFYERIAIIMLAVNSAVNGLLYGFGFTGIAGIMNLSRVIVFRLPLLIIMLYAADIGYQSVGIAMMISNILIGVMSIVVCIIYLIKIKKQNIDDNLTVGKTVK